MRRVLAGLALLAAVGGASHTVRAAEAPFVTPQGDVDVTYAVPMPDGSNGGQRMRWSRTMLVQRVDLDGSATYMVTDYKARTLHVLDSRNRTRTDMPAPGAGLTPPGEHAAGEFHAEAEDHVAGEACQWWRTADTDGKEARFCYSNDGILLSAQRAGQIVARAVHVDRIPQDGSVFAMPADYRTISTP